MFGLFKRKKKKSDEEQDKKSKDKVLSQDDKSKKLKSTLDEELEKEEKRKKKKPPEGPNWPAFIVLLIAMFLGIFFFIYGRINRLGLSGLVPEFPTQEHNVKSEVKENNQEVKPTDKLKKNSEGLIIFEKE